MVRQHLGSMISDLSWLISSTFKRCSKSSYTSLHVQVEMTAGFNVYDGSINNICMGSGVCLFQAPFYAYVSFIKGDPCVNHWFANFLIFPLSLLLLCDPLRYFHCRQNFKLYIGQCGQKCFYFK